MGDLPALEGTAQPGAGIVSAEAAARVGMRVGDFEIESFVGEGGTGVVYRGRHVASDRPVAIKILHDRGARQKDVVEQFIGEGRSTSRIRHPNVVDVIDLGTAPDGTVFLVMEYLKGESLRSRLHSVTRLPLFEAINILRQVARGLGAAHEVGIVHGGLKPADIFLCKRKGRRRIVRRSKAQGMRLVVEPEDTFDLVKLLDFGMARFLDLAPGAQARAGAVHGTLHYLSPEQAQGQPADQQSDIYALGAVFYEMITGAVPFAGESLLDILRGHVSGQVIAPSRRTPRAGIDGHIDALILKCLKKNPLLRFASTGDLCDALDACIADCAFLRDAHRLPGINESGIDLSEALPKARQDSARSVEQQAIAEKPAAAAPVAEKPVETKSKKKPAAAPAVAKAVAAPFVKPVVKPLAATAVFVPSPAWVADKPATIAAAQTRANARANALLAEDPYASVKTPAPTVSAIAEDPYAAVKTPAPTATAIAEDPYASVKTPTPTVVAADAYADSSAEVAERPARFKLEEEVLPRSRRPQSIALAGVLLVGVGMAVWATRGGSTRNTAKTVVAAKPVVAVQAVAPSTPAPLPPSPPQAPTVVAAAPAPVPSPALLAVAPQAAPAAQADPVPTSAPSPSPPPRAAHGPGKVALARTRPAQASSTRRKTWSIPVQAERVPAPAVESARAPALVAESAPAPGSVPALAAGSPPAPVTPAPAAESENAQVPVVERPPAPATVDDLVHEAQRAWMAGHYAAAIGKAQSALKAEPKPAQAMQAYEIIATSSCAIGQADDAREASSHLSDAKRELVKTTCAKHGVTID